MNRTARPLLAIAGLLASSWIPVATAAEKKDVLFIAVDDLNDWVSHLGGHPQAHTPNIDRLVKRGLVFTNAHCTAPACNPSRASLMSGLRPWESGIYTNSDPAAGVMSETQTLNRHFMAQGYHTVGGGKLYHGYQAEGREDTWTTWVGNFPSAYKKEANFNGLNNAQFDWGPLEIAPSEMGDYKLTDWAIGQLDQAPADKPLFLAVGYVKPHLPWYVPQEYFDRYPLDSIQLPVVKEDDLDDVPAAGVKMARPEGDHAAVVAAGQWKNAVQGYLATIAFLDDQVGRLLDAVEASERGRNMIVVWWTDHGWHLGEKQHWRKFALWERATRTSFAITVPGVAQPASTTAAPVDYLSVFPTVCELAGVPVPAHVRGPSLVPLLKNPQAEWEHLAICTHGRGNHAVVDSRWRYIRYADGSEELYDHSKDPNEWTNLAGAESMNEVKQRLASAIPAADAEVAPTLGEPAKAKAGKKAGKSKKVP